MATAITDLQTRTQPDAISSFDTDTQTRLARLEAENLAFLKEQSLYKTAEERNEAMMMKSPLSTADAAKYFGAMLGMFPPFAVFCKLFLTDLSFVKPETIFFIVAGTVLCTFTGWFAGKVCARAIASSELNNWNLMILCSPLIGILWGIIAGGLGGLIFFILGAIPGAVIAAMVGAAAFPAFMILHKMLKKGELIEEKHFFPISLGITLTITAFILGL